MLSQPPVTPSPATPGLSDPLVLACGLTLPNRIAKAAMTESVADPRTHDASVRHERLYRRFAQGGIGLSITGNVVLDRRHLERTGNVVVDARSDMGALARWAEAAQTGGVPAIVQVSHPGRQCSRFVTREPVAPSAVQVDVLGSFARPRALADDEVDAIATRYAEAANDVVTAGFAGVQIHAAHGYLISQFLSPLSNLRTDRWGGELDARARFLLEIVRRTRARLGPSKAIAVKLNSADFQRGGFEEDDAVQVARWLEAEGIDLLEISGGNYESPALLVGTEAAQGSARRRKRAGTVEEPPSTDARTRAREAYFLDFAERLRREVKLPLMLTGGLRSAEVMRRIVAEGSVDLVGLARPLALEPDLPRRILAGGDVESATRSLRVGWKALDAMVEAGWYGAQLARMADGLEPNPRLCRARALTTYLGGEARNALRVGRRG